MYPTWQKINALMFSGAKITQLIGSGNDMSLVRCQAITWTNSDLSSIDPSAEHHSRQFKLKNIWKCHLQSSGHFIEASVFQHIVMIICFSNPTGSWQTLVCIPLVYCDWWQSYGIANLNRRHWTAGPEILSCWQQLARASRRIIFSRHPSPLGYLQFQWID